MRLKQHDTTVRIEPSRAAAVNKTACSFDQEDRGVLHLLAIGRFGACLMLRTHEMWIAPKGHPQLRRMKNGVLLRPSFFLHS